jgi:transposase
MGKITTKQRGKIPQLLRKGFNYSDIAEQFGCTRQNICYHARGHHPCKASRSYKHFGRPSKISKNLENRIVKVLKEKKNLGSRKLVPLIRTKLGIDICERTLRRFSSAKGFKWHTPLIKPYITPKGVIKRLEFAQEHRDIDMEAYIFSDEATFELNGCSRGERYEKGHRPIREKLAHPQKLHVWWGISLSYEIKPYFFRENLTASLYISILESRLPSRVENDWIFQQDNDPKHKSKISRNWLNANTPRWMDDWPPYSPDLNVIENLWAIVKRKVYEVEIGNLDQLERRIRKVIKELNVELINSTILSFPKRLKAVIKARGRHTKY